MIRRLAQLLLNTLSPARNRPANAALVICLLISLAALPGCHKHDDTATPAQSQPVVALPPLPKPTAPLAKGTTCVTAQCHTTYKTAQHIHGPVSADACQACHAEDQGNHHYPLIRQGNAMCTFCHVVSGTKAHQHKALEEAAGTGPTPATQDSTLKTQNSKGGCLTCHDPHISKAKFLLTADNVQQVCEKCHDLPLKKHAHEPFAAGQCTVCHQAHQADNKALLRYGDGPDHCYGCHKDKQTSIAQMPHVHKASAESCTTCHGPHATDNAKQLKKPVNDTCLSCHNNVQAELAKAKQVHGAMTAGNCASCHDPHASAQPAELKARTDKVCMTCHDKDVKAADGRTLPGMAKALASKNLHGPVKNGSCSDCHLPHAADQPNLLKKYFPDTFYAKFDLNNYALCFSCHDQQLVLKSTTTLTNFRDGDKNLHFVHVNRDEKGRTCKTCHEVHGSDLPKHMAATVPFEGSNWPMPINYTEKADGGTCAPACHAEKTYTRSKTAGTQPAGGQP
jgi:predicted CXXCH cytochrome family protein